MRSRTIAVSVSSAALIGVLSACGSSSTPATQATPTTGVTASSATSAAQANADDIAFSQLMIPHHQQAVGMADLALARASSTQIKALATQIKAAQGPEITTMSAWLTAWGQPSTMPTSSGMDGMDMGGMTAAGMMSGADLASLGTAAGPAFDRSWLRMMIAHHEGATQMAEQVLSRGRSAEVKALAQTIIAGQTAEIATMTKLLAGR
jgi:uncharacterized protein (DUF305 family)